MPLWGHNGVRLASVMSRRMQLRPGAQLPPAAMCLAFDTCLSWGKEETDSVYGAEHLLLCEL